MNDEVEYHGNGENEEDAGNTRAAAEQKGVAETKKKVHKEEKGEMRECEKCWK